MPQADRFLKYPVRDTAVGMELQSSIQPGDTAFSVNRIIGFNDSDTPFLARLWAEQPNGFREDSSEFVKVTAVDDQNNTLTVERGVEDTGGLSAGVGDPVQPMIVRRSMFDDIGSNIFKMSVETGEIESAQSDGATFEANVLKFEDFAFDSDEASVKWNYGQTGNDLSNTFDDGDSVSSPQKVSSFTSGSFDGSEVSYSPLTESSNTLVDIAIGEGYVAYGSQDTDCYVHSLSDSSLVYTFKQSNDSIFGIDISKKYLIYDGTDENAYVHNLSDGSLEYELSQPSDESSENAYDVAIGVEYAAYGGQDNKVHVHDLSDGSQVYTFYQSSGAVEGIAIDNGYIAYGGSDNNVYVHSLTDGNELSYSPITNHSDAIQGLAFDEGYIAYNGGGNDQNTHVNDLSDGSLVYTLSAASNNLRDVSIGDGFVGYAGFGDDCYVHSLNDGSLTDTLTQSSSFINGVAIGEGYIAYGSDDSDGNNNYNTYVHNGTNGFLSSNNEYQYQAVIKTDKETRRGKIQRFGTDFFPKTNRETGSFDSGELETLHGELELVTESNADVSFEYGKKGFGFPSSTPTTNFGDSKDFQETPATFDGSETSYSPLTKSSKSIIETVVGERYVAYGGNDNNVYVHGTDNGNEASYSPLTQLSTDVNGLGIGEGFVAYGGNNDNNVYVHDLSDGSPVYTLSEHSGNVNGLGIGEGFVAYGGGYTYVYNLNDGSLIYTLKEAGSPSNEVAIGEGYVAYSSFDNNCYVHDLTDGSLNYTLTESSNNLFEVDIGNGFVGYCGNDENVYVHDLSDGSLTYTLTEASGNNLDGIAIGEGYVAYGGDDSNTYIHDLSNGNLIQTLSQGSDDTEEIDINGGYVVYGGEDSRAYVYNGAQSTLDRSAEYEYRAVAESNGKVRKGIVREFTTTS